MIAFWLVAGVLAAAATALILLRAAGAVAQADAPDPAPAVYRRQLAEIDELAKRGLIGEAERKSAHAEAARRLLAAADAKPQAWSAEPRPGWPLLVAVGLAPAAALALYLALGQPGMGDRPFAARLAQWRAASPETLAPPELAAVLRQLTRERPHDPQGYRFLAIAEDAAQNPAGAVRALRRAVGVAPERAELWEMLGQAQVAAAGGEVTAEARASFEEALRRDPSAVAARFHLARRQIDAGDRAAGLAVWRALLAEMPADDPRREPLAAAIAEAQAGPARPDFSQEETAGIRRMVQGLAERLRANPDDPEGWVRLVRAYAVLGESGKRDDALTQAKARYASRPDIAAQLDAAARVEP